ncbi:MAG: hypothetical protein GF331_14265, partial [Chitinivibrionales bacterium]|nr:hypothetical protein [Chitinivibrionales bacterium]
MAERYLTTYYFHGQDLCMVPRHVREDIAWMKDHGVDGVCVGVHEADLQGGNHDLVVSEIERAGLDVWLIPSRLGGLVAGWHRAPGYFAAANPECCARNADGTTRTCFGPMLSVFHPRTAEFLAETVNEMLRRFPARGIVWDELKSLDGEDHSRAALDALGRPAAAEDMLGATAACFSAANRRILEQHPALEIVNFIYASCEDTLADACAGIDGLTRFGCDGKCWLPGESDDGEGGSRKVLLGGVLERFKEAAAARGLESFALLETQLLGVDSLELTMRYLPELLDNAPDHLC